MIYILILLPSSYISFKMFNWCYYSDRNKTPFAFWFFLAIGGIISSFALLTVVNILVLTLDDFSPHFWTIGPRVAMAFFLNLSAYLIKHAQSANIDLGNLSTTTNGNGHHPYNHEERPSE